MITKETLRLIYNSHEEILNKCKITIMLIKVNEISEGSKTISYYSSNKIEIFCHIILEWKPIVLILTFQEFGYKICIERRQYIHYVRISPSLVVPKIYREDEVPIPVP